MTSSELGGWLIDSGANIPVYVENDSHKAGGVIEELTGERIRLGTSGGVRWAEVAILRTPLGTIRGLHSPGSPPILPMSTIAKKAA